MPDTAYVTTGKPKVAGAVYRAPKGTALPTTATETLNGAFVDMGYISEDGVTNSNSPTTDKIKEWGGQTVLVVATDKPDSFKLTFLEALNYNVLEMVYGANNVTLNGSTISVQANADALEENSYVIDMVMTGGSLHRIVIPAGSLSALGDVVYKSNEAVGYEVTLEALPDSGGNNHYEYYSLAGGSDFAVALDKSTLSVAHGSSAQLVATTTPAGMHVMWGSSAPSKATVDQAGLVTGVAAGSAIISATFGGVSASCTVTVT